MPSTPQHLISLPNGTLNLPTCCFGRNYYWRRKWQPTPVSFPGESQGQGSLVGCHLRGRKESDTTEAT